MAAPALYGITARRGDELVRCEDVTDLAELIARLAAYLADFAADPAVRVDVETVPAG